MDTGEALPLEIPDKTQAPYWLPDGSGFVYQNLKDPEDPYSGQVLFHRMGDATARDDPVLFRQFTQDENEKLATTWGPFGALSRDGRWLVLGYWIDTRSNDLWLVDFDRYLRDGHGRARGRVGRRAGPAFGTVVDGTLFLQTTKGAPNGRVVAVARERAGRGALARRRARAARRGDPGRRLREGPASPSRTSRTRPTSSRSST